MNNIDTQGNIVTDKHLKVPIPDNIDKYLLENNDIVFNNTNSVDLIGKSAIFKGEWNKCTYSNHLTRLRTNNDIIFPKWLLYQLIHSWELNYFHRICNRHVNQAGIRRIDIENFRFPLPPIPEQKRIITVIDNIDSLIQTTQRLIDKLTELKKGLMQKLFTEGIGHIEFKTVKLGVKEPKIPSSWSVKTFDSLVDEELTGLNIAKVSQSYEKDTYYIKMNNVNINGSFDFTDLVSVDVNDDVLQKYQLKVGDLLFNVRNSLELVGKTAVMHESLKSIVFNNNLVRYRFKKSLVSSDYVNYYLHTHIGKTELHRIKAAITSVVAIYKKDIKKIKVVLPPKVEQDKIISILRNIDLKIKNNNRYKTILNKTKKGLMQVLLTGKKRVPLD